MGPPPLTDDQALTIVDTSALVALFLKEPRWDDIAAILRDQNCAIPAPVLLEFATVTSGRYRQPQDAIDLFLSVLTENANINVAPFDTDDASTARAAARLFGKGRRNHAQLNIVDLMVYGIARRLGAPILCTGRDFAETDALIHPASRLS